MSLTKKLFLAIWCAGTLGSLAVLPYTFHLQRDILQSVPLPLPLLALLSIIQGAVLMAVVTSLGLFFAKRVGFTFPVFEQAVSQNSSGIQWKSFLPFPIALGIATGTAIMLVDYLFKLAGVVIDATYLSEIPLWKSFFAAFYGGITEEILLRLFLLSVLVWGLSKVSQREAPLSQNRLVWFAITITAILFGLGHLPAILTMTQLTPLIIARTIVLNGIAGLVFGWLYWKKGLESAMVAHFTADIIILVIVPIVLRFI